MSGQAARAAVCHGGRSGGGRGAISVGARDGQSGQAVVGAALALESARAGLGAASDRVHGVLLFGTDSDASAGSASERFATLGGGGNSAGVDGDLGGFA